jgi:hypothetical protein
LVRIATIVEGHGEAAAVPILLRRIGDEVAPGARLEVPRPRDLAPEIPARAVATRSTAGSIAGHRGIRADSTAPPEPVAIGDAKGWLSGRMPAGSSHRETLDQPGLTAIVDLALARRVPSFDKLWRDVSAPLR